ncbi:MAG: redoxin family protein [Bacteroidota bacterium]
MKCLLTSLIIFVSFSLLSAQQGHHLSLEIDNYEGPKIYLANYYGSATNNIDSATVDSSGQFIFSSDTALERGLYIVWLPLNRKRKAIQLIVEDNDQRVSVKADYEALSSTKIEVADSKSNTRFYDYLRYMNRNSQLVGQLSKARQESEEGAEKQVLQERMDSVSNAVRAYQQNLLDQYPQSIVATQARLDLEPPFPTTSDNEEEQQNQRYRYRRQHFFDYIDLADSSLLASPRFVRKINHYLTKLTPPVPDSVAPTVDNLIAQLPPGSPNHRFLMDYLLKSYEKPRYIGLDAVYVHLAETYYAAGPLSWLDERERITILKTAQRLKPILIGKTAPNIVMQKEDGSSIALHDVKAELTVLFFWRPNCGYCKKATPVVLEAYEKYKDRGVEVFGLCTSLRQKTPKCWEDVEEKEMNVWINTADSANKSRFVQKYNVGRTPKFYLLDKDKKILIKDFGVEQLTNLLERFLPKEDKSTQQHNE